MCETNFWSYHLHTLVIEEVQLICCIPLLYSGYFKHVESFAGPPYDAEEHSTRYIRDTVENTYPTRSKPEHHAYARTTSPLPHSLPELPRMSRCRMFPSRSCTRVKSHSGAGMYLLTFVPPFIVGVTSCGALVLTGDNRDRRRERGKERIVGHLAHYIQTLILLFICTEWM